MTKEVPKKWQNAIKWLHQESSVRKAEIAIDDMLEWEWIEGKVNHALTCLEREHGLSFDVSPEEYILSTLTELSEHFGIEKIKQTLNDLAEQKH